jgi:hypothetical protein
MMNIDENKTTVSLVIPLHQKLTEGIKRVDMAIFLFECNL